MSTIKDTKLLFRIILKLYKTEQFRNHHFPYLVNNYKCFNLKGLQ